MDEYLQLNAPMNPMSAALRRRQSAGDLGMLTGDPVLSRLGAQLGESAGSEAWREAQTEMQRRGVLSRALADRDDRAARSAEANTQREFLAEQGNLNRGLELAVARLRAEQGVGGVSMKDMLRYRRDLSRDLEKAGLPESEKSISQVDKLLEKYPSGDIPGVGPLGRWSQGERAREIRGTQAAISNILLRARSGAAVTEPEFERFSKELLGDGWLKNDTDFRRSWADLKARISEKKENIMRGYDPEIVSLFEEEQEAANMAPSGGEGGGKSYRMGEEISVGRKKYRVTGGDPNDPDVEEIK